MTILRLKYSIMSTILVRYKMKVITLLPNFKGDLPAQAFVYNYTWIELDVGPNGVEICSFWSVWLNVDEICSFRLGSLNVDIM